MYVHENYFETIYLIIILISLIYVLFTRFTPHLKHAFITHTTQHTIKHKLQLHLL